jgi:hypothetical protein
MGLAHPCESYVYMLTYKSHSRREEFALAGLIVVAFDPNSLDPDCNL